MNFINIESLFIMKNSCKKKVFQIIINCLPKEQVYIIYLMGGGGGSRVVYHQNPHTVAALNNLRSQFNQLNYRLAQEKQAHDAELQRISEQYRKQLRQLNYLSDPKNIEEAEEKLFINFVNNLKSFKIVNPIPKSNNYRYAAIIGENSAGKSSIFNWIFGTKLEVGIDDTTPQIVKVHSDSSRKMVYFDSPGLNQTFNITHAEYLKAFYDVDCMFIATSVTFKNSIKTIQVMNKINPPMLYLVRNQCDKFQTQVQLNKAFERDHNLLKQYNITNVKQILYVSTKMDDSFLHNAELKKLMRGQKM